MSLFPSAFETGPSGSRQGTIAVPNAGKRKRTSLGGKGEDQLRATQANLAKLMDKVERGEVREKSGNEGIGHAQKKKKGDKGQAQAQAQAPPQPQSKQKGDKPKGKFDNNGGDKAKGKFDKGDKQKGGKFDKANTGTPDKSKRTPNNKGKDSKSTPTPTKKGTPKGAGKDAATPVPNAKGKGKPTPTQLPAPVVQAKAEETEEPLTDMQRQMRTKLEGARFRWINEQLYSTPSTEAVAMMKKDPKIFADYHAAHRSQTAAWPSPPLPHILQLLAPLPKGTVIADLGCGDAGLARALVPKGKVVLSYDLVGDSGVEGSEVGNSEGWVVRADFLTHVPLPGRPGGVAEEGKKQKKKVDPHASEVVDVVVCCLSLMGTNWIGGIYEAVRILKQGGTFHVAEVTSRFVSTEAFVEAVTSFGLVLENQEEPSTHFTLFRFTKKTAVPAGPSRGEPGWEERVRAGEEILRACVYKKR